MATPFLGKEGGPIAPSYASVAKPHIRRYPTIPSIEVRSFFKEGKHAICFSKKDLDWEHAYMSTHMAALKFSLECPTFPNIRSSLILKTGNIHMHAQLNLEDLAS